jgi:hypothetical protein
MWGQDSCGSCEEGHKHLGSINSLNFLTTWDSISFSNRTAFILSYRSPAKWIQKLLAVINNEMDSVGESANSRPEIVTFYVRLKFPNRDLYPLNRSTLRIASGLYAIQFESLKQVQCFSIIINGLSCIGLRIICDIIFYNINWTSWTLLFRHTSVGYMTRPEPCRRSCEVLSLDNSYRKENTTFHHYKDQLVNAVQGNIPCL